MCVECVRRAFQTLETADEDQEAADLVFAWLVQSGRLGEIGTLNGIGAILAYRRISEDGEWDSLMDAVTFPPQEPGPISSDPSDGNSDTT